MKDLLRPSVLNDETRGVGAAGKGWLPPALERTVTICGVVACKVGDAGKTKRVCDGVLIEE